MKHKEPCKGNEPLQVFSQRIVQMYLLLMLGIFPLYYQDKYYNIGDAKYQFFLTATLGMLVLLGICLFYILMIPDGDLCVGRLSLQDAAVLGYMAAAAGSWVLSPYKDKAWIGSHEWYMGLSSQLLFAGIYFAVSRFATRKQWPLWVMGASGALAFLAAYLHRFRIDPLGLYEGISEHYQILFLGTIGQATWYSSYLCVILPLMMGIYMVAFPQKPETGRTENKPLQGSRLAHILTGAFLFLGFGTAVTQNSDSAYIGLGLALALLLWFSLENLQWWKRFVEILLLALGAIKLTGLLQMAFPERTYALEPISMALTQGTWTWIFLAVAAVVYVFTCYLYGKRAKTGQEYEKVCLGIGKIRLILYGILALAVLALPLLMWLHTTGKITSDTGLLSQSGYLLFDDSWGNGRGKTWKYAFRILAEFPLVNKLFGCGPDSMSFYTAAYHQAEIDAMWGGLTLTNAHNEWLTALVNYGLVGTAAYVSVFVAAVGNVFRSWKEQPLLVAAGAAVLSYVGHNFFCYQQAVCTPLIFIVLGAAEFLRIRKGTQRGEVSHSDFS